MFTKGIDKTAIDLMNKQGRDVNQPKPRVRSPLSEIRPSPKVPNTFTSSSHGYDSVVDEDAKSVRRYTTDTELGFPKSAPSSVRAVSLRDQPAISTGSSCLQKGTPTDIGDLRTPSGSTIMESSESSGDRNSESSELYVDCCLYDKAHSSLQRRQWSSELSESGNKNRTEEKPEYSFNCQTNSVEYSTRQWSSELSMHALIVYDACMQVCFQAWTTSGSIEAMDFLQNQWPLLRSTLGLQKYLLQPQHAQQTEFKTAKHVEQIKMKKVVGKIRVEVKELRVLPRRKLKNTSSLKSAIYTERGKEHNLQVSSLAKSGMNKLYLSLFSVTSQEPFSCLFQLKSSTEDTQDVELRSAICLLPGSGNYHIFFPESEADAVLVEVQDSKRSLQGRAVIPISSLSENPSDQTRWWPLYRDDKECIGKIQLSIGRTITCHETSKIKSGSVTETLLAYDMLVEAAMRGHNFHSRNLRFSGPWKWILNEFGDYYGVSHSYTLLRYLSHVMDISTPTRYCLELVKELVVPILKAKSEKTLTTQEKSILLHCETRLESLLASLFEDYKSFDENTLASAVEVYGLHDTQDALRNYLQTAVKKICRKHMYETDEFVSSSFGEGFKEDSITVSIAYLKMKNLCSNIINEIQTDIKIHNQNIFPSFIDLPNLSSCIYSTELCNTLRAFLIACPPSSLSPHVAELIVATADFKRDLLSWQIRHVKGGVDAKELFHLYIIIWIKDKHKLLLESCELDKVKWSEVRTQLSTTAFVDDLYDRLSETLVEYEVIISRWPEYISVLENAIADAEKAIVKALDKQYADVLLPLKEILTPKKYDLNKYVQKLTKRPVYAYAVPNELGILLNAMKRMLDILCPKIEARFKLWGSCIPDGGGSTLPGEQLSEVTFLLRTKFRKYVQAVVDKLAENSGTKLKMILHGESDVGCLQQLITNIICHLQTVFDTPIFVDVCHLYWDKLGQDILSFLKTQSGCRVSRHVISILNDVFVLHAPLVEAPRSITEIGLILC